MIFGSPRKSLSNSAGAAIINNNKKWLQLPIFETTLCLFVLMTFTFLESVS